MRGEAERDLPRQEMAHSPNEIDEVESIVVEEVEVLGFLIECLKKEREAIIDYDLKTLTEVFKSKHENLVRIEVLETSRRGLVKKLGKTLMEILEEPSSPISNDQADRIRHTLSCLRSMAQAVQEFNNGQREYILHSLYDVQTTLSLLDTLKGRGLTACYDGQGIVKSNRESASSVMSRSV